MRKFTYFLIFTFLISIPSVIFAAPPGGIGQITTGQPIGKEVAYTEEGVANIFISLINWFAWFVAAAAVVAGLYAGFMFITAGGDEGKLKKAKDIIVYSVVGVIVAILSFSIVAIAQALLIVY